MTLTPRRSVVALTLGALVLGGLIAAPAWAADAASCAPVAGADRVGTDTSLVPGKPITSPHGAYSFGLTADGQLALKNTRTGGRVWLKQAGSRATATFDSAGVLNLESSTGDVVWQSRKTGACSVLVVQDAGRVVAMANGRMVWAMPAAAAAWNVALPIVATATPSPAPAPSAVPSVTESASDSPSASASPSTSPSATASASASASPSASAPPSASASPSASTAAKPPSSPSPSATKSASSSPSASSSASASSPPATNGGAAASRRDASQYPFSSTSPWNSAIGSGAKFQSASDAATRDLQAAATTVNATKWSFAIFESRDSDAMQTVTNTATGAVYKLRMPSSTAPTEGTDGHVGVVLPDGVTGYEFYKLAKVGTNTWTTTRVVITDLRGDATGGARASNTSIFAGLIRTQELSKLSIKHAVAFSVPNAALKNGFVWPATAQDSDGAKVYSGSIPMGSLAAIPPNVDLNSLGLSEAGLALGHALQDYGGYVALRASNTALYCEQTCDPTQVTALKAAWKTLLPLMRVVTNNSPTSVGGGGTPHVSALPEMG